ncbi:MULTISPECIES: CBS domain-containing protein [Alteromonas]|mgnify:FL=1|jgi:acetoin utilization protein AcuB|uniref:CBS domain-containing protein n=1 Tax=Alteromonas TaxID=226 RepID=UPI000B66CC85|nr:MULTISPECIES: CBS domain-containing protein [unclassified Alteromonas]MAI38324.1 CBS domain-containing protein [Alteromonas sp.]OUX86080.1 MAG: CBS domain-containing protein [Alteromonas sp. TMED35]|tara:strand:- start:48856 stop:49275 length:420 start_codon:yes stop_codon:yes gene_type:complete
MSVANIMSKRVVSVYMDDSLQSLRELFTATGFHHLVVVHDNKLQGIISDRDLLKAVSPFVDTISERMADRATLDKRAHQIMTREVITLSPESSIFTAIELFNSNKISCIPIVDEKSQPVGMVSWRDVMRFMQQRVESKR